MRTAIAFLTIRAGPLSRFVGALVAMAVVAGCVSIVDADERKRPNVLFILIDVFGWKDLEDRRAFAE